MLDQENECGGIVRGDRDKLDLLYLSAIGSSSLTMEQIREMFPPLAALLSLNSTES